MSSESAAIWRAGTASETYTPTEPLWLAGYLVRREPAKGKISELTASALALEDSSGNRLVICSIDLIAITKIVADPVYEAVERKTGLKRQQLVLAATHTHYAPEFRPDKAPLFLIPDEFAAKIERTASRIVEVLTRVIVGSLRNMEPVRLYMSQTSANFAHNRRRMGVKGGNPSTEDVLDQGVPVLWTRAISGITTAILFGYACHNTTIPPEDCRYCADWAGFAKDQLQRDNPEATSLFITGCGADQNPEPRGSVELSRKYGIELAGAVQAAIDAGGTEIIGTIRSALSDVSLMLQPMSRQIIDEMIKSDDNPAAVKGKFLLDQLQRGQPLITEYAAPMQAVMLGDQLLMIVMSGEAVVDWSHKFKQEFATAAPNVWVAAYCNDMYGYVPTRRIQTEGGYEGGRANLWSWLPAPFADDVEDRVTHAVRNLVHQVTR
jgi:hypothetical protein